MGNTTHSISFNFLNDAHSRRAIRLVVISVYFIIFQFLILLQKPFVQLDFIIIFYLVFASLFSHHLFDYFKYNRRNSIKSGLFSYLFDFLVLMFFMRYFPYLSSFILVLQLFFLFIASFDLDFFKLALLGFAASLGISVINLSVQHVGSVQSTLSLVLFNLSYLSVIIISRQLSAEFSTLQTDLTRTWKKWKSQEGLAKSLIEKLPFGLAVMQSNSELVLQNSYLTDKLKLSSQKLQELIFSYSSRSKSLPLDSDIQSEQRVYNFDQTTYFDAEINENLKLFLIKDVTDLRILESQLKEKEKLAAVGTLAAGIAHEIRNPLAGISGSIQMLSQEESVSSMQKKLMHIILKEIDRLNTLISEFLDYAKPDLPLESKMDLEKVVEEVLTTLRQHPDIATHFQWKVDLQSIIILGAGEKLKQAFLNIMINSIQAMKNSVQPSLAIKLYRDGRQAILSIADTGSGMSEETKKKMFEPFHTTKPKGTGLGLAITHKILEHHKAQIYVKSELNIGTEFIIKFPLI